MRATSYLTYKNSGIEWLGQIPAHWDVKRIKHFAYVRRGASPRPIDDPSYFDDDGEFAWVRIADLTASDRYLEGTTQRLSKLGQSKSVCLAPGELFLSIAATVGKPIITRIKCCIHDGFVYFEGLTANAEFLWYMLQCGEAYKGLGKLGTQLNLNTETVGGICAPAPSDREQEAIVSFLDRETAKIDALVEKKERLIELLQEKRTALITHAVTKGLDPNIPLRDSGIEWLGQIPAHWSRTAIRYACSLVRDGTHQPPSRVVDGYRLLSVRNIIDGAFVFRDDDSRISEDDFQALQRSFTIRQGDILLAIVGATLGKVAIVGALLEPFTIQRSLGILRPREKVIEAGYLAYVVECSSFQQLLWANAGYSAQPGLYLNTLGGFRIPLPEIGEQQAIADFLDRETTKIDALIAKVCEAIERLKEYRTALISAAVTGKIDVRSEAAR